ncbi:hypothetical protein H072_4275 [Dactylellina haptotyla CBS 200.50]|uniref:Uncharacterized protein n=1 Tax=Dactylellina haptotyla (strain CBS 200.50) TaxID=1284197 RepID=S8AL05_DACHA|nr:hypothetical protein H072_4275 [Dactylellina haptotyla CBS 200.50]
MNDNVITDRPNLFRFVSSTIQIAYDADIGKNRSSMRPLFDALNTTLYYGKPPKAIDPSLLAYPFEDQKFFGTNDTAYLPIYAVAFYISTDVWATTNRNGTSSNLSSSYLVGLLSHQYPKDMLDGRLGLGDIRPAVPRTSLRASEEIDATRAAHSLCLPFATYFPRNLIRGPSPLLQCFIDGEKGDTTRYRPVDENTNLLWLDCSGWEKWSLRPLSIVISGKTYPMSHEGLLKMGVNESYSLLVPQVHYQDVVLVDSATAWTRLYPWIVSEIYRRIPNSEYYHYTYFIPCSVTLKDIPNISFNFNSTLGNVIGLNASKVDFAVDTYRHPEKDELCAGTIQQIIETSVTTNGEMVSPGDTMGDFGHWIFKSWYMVFKVVEDSDGRRRRQIGLAHYL